MNRGSAYWACYKAKPQEAKKLSVLSKEGRVLKGQMDKEEN